MAITSEQIKQKAKELGFSDCGIAKAKEIEGFTSVLKEMLSKNLFADMLWMGNNIEKRANPELILENAKSVISVLYNYYPEKHQIKDSYNISKYAYGKDYHDVIKRKLWKLQDFIQENTEYSVGSRAFVDSAPVAERSWAVKSGLGWIGKNSLLLTKKGSFFFLGEIITDLPLEYDKEYLKNHCGSCTNCIDSCPTQAIISPSVIDANKCISYQTIENRGEIDTDLKGKFNNYIYGCDICQDVCPWNKKSTPHNEPEFTPHSSLLTNSKTDWENISEENFREIFRKSAVKRTKYKGLKRNINYVSK